MKTKRYMYRWILAVGFLLFAMAYGCGSSDGSASGLTLGVDIPETEHVVKLTDVMKKPSEYNGKSIVMKGFVSGQCASLCEFFFKDGVHNATIYPQGFKFPKLELNKGVTVYTQVISGEEQVVFSALGIEM